MCKILDEDRSKRAPVTQHPQCTIQKYPVFRFFWMGWNPTNLRSCPVVKFFSPQPLNLLPTYPYLPHFSSLLFPFPAHHFLLHLLFFFLSPFVSLLFHSLFSLVLCFFLFLFVFVLHLFLCFLSLVLYVFTLCVKKELWK